MNRLFLFFILISAGFAQGLLKTEGLRAAELQFDGGADGVPHGLKQEPDVGNWDLFAELLVWYASEETSSYWASRFSLGSPRSAAFTAKELSFDWNFGVRGGFGYHFSHDDWDTQVYWTWYQAEGRSSIPASDHTLLLLTEFFAGFINGDLALSGKIHWDLDYNMMDWELGRCFWVSRALSLRPFIGLKGGWIDQTIRSKWEDVVFFPFAFYSSREDLKNNFWGIGPSGGVNCQWKFGRSKKRFFSLLGDFSAAMMWGNWTNTDQYKNTLSREIDVNMKNSTLVASMLQGKIGVGWETDFNQGRCHFSTQLGYEGQIWFNQLRIATFQQLRLHGDLTLQGGTFKCRFDF